MSKNTSTNPNAKKGKALKKSRRQILLDLASALQGPLSDTTSASGAGSGPEIVDLFLKFDPEVSTTPKSTSPSVGDDDSVTDRHYNPA